LKGEIVSAEIRIDQETVRALVAKGIVDSLGGEQQQIILSQAVEGLLRDTEQYGKAVPGTSPLARAFQTQVNAVAIEIVKDYLDTPELKARIAEAARAGVDKLMSENLDWLDDAITSGITSKIKLVVKEKWEQ
jgi:hypothetical protein